MFEQSIYQMVDQENGKEIKEVLDTDNNKVIWERAIPTYDTPIIPTRNAPLLEVSIDGVCSQADTPTPSSPVDIMCNNGRVVAGNCISDIPDGQGTFITPSEWTTNRVYKAFPTDLVVGQSYTVTVTGANWLILVQQKKTDGTGSSNVSGWVTTYDFTPEEGYIYGVTMRRSQDNITPADFNGTLTLDTTDGKPWTVGTPEVLTVKSANLFDASAVPDENKYVQQATGRLLSPTSVDSTFVHSDFVPVVGGNTYFFGQTAYSAQAAGIAWYSEPSDTAYISGKSGTSLKNAGMILTAPSDAKYVRFSIRTSEGYDSDWQHSVYLCEVVDGSPVLTAWQAYSAQTATVPNLFAVGDYADTAELIHGLLTHKVGVKVLDGTESIGTSNACFTIAISDRAASKTDLLCSHFPYSTKTSSQTEDETVISFSSTNIGFRLDACADKTAFAAWLKAQYAQGTPVIVIYPLKEEIIEQITPQTIQGYRRNVMVVTAQSQYVSGQNIKVKYLGIDNLLNLLNSNTPVNTGD